jgi:hypothetical protein
MNRHSPAREQARGIDGKFTVSEKQTLQVRFRTRHRLALLCYVLFAFTLPCLGDPPTHTCPAVRFEGEVRSGQSFEHRIGPGLTLVLDPLPSGWVLRVLPTGKARPPHDLAELATPPYRSPNPLLISTDFAFRAQDAIGWNPRAFRYFTTAAEMGTATAAYEATVREPNRPSAGAALFPLLPQACPGELQIVDARIAGGTADQSRMAATVASHFAETAHTLSNASSTPLGRIEVLKFRVILSPAGKTPGASVHGRP